MNHFLPRMCIYATLQLLRLTVQTYERSVTWTKVSLKEAKIRATPKTSSPVGDGCQWVVFSGWLCVLCEPSLTWGPREMFSCAPRSTFFLGAMVAVGVVAYAVRTGEGWIW